MVVHAAVEICDATSAVWWDPEADHLSPGMARGLGAAWRRRASRKLLPYRDLLAMDNGVPPVLEISRADVKHAALLESLGADRGVVIPARDGRRWLGALSVQDGAFDPPRLERLVALVEQAGAALRSLKCPKSGHDNRAFPPGNARLGSPTEPLAALVASALSLDELLPAVCRLAAQVAEAETCLLFLAENGGHFALRMQAGRGLPAAAHFPQRGSGATKRCRGKCARSERTAAGADRRFRASAGLRGLAELTRAHPGEEILQRRGEPATAGPGKRPVRELREGRFEAVLAVPLSARGGALGALLLLSESKKAFPPQRRQAVRSLAASAAVAIENLQLLESTQNRLLELADLSWVGARTAATQDAGKIAEMVADAAAKALGLPRVALFLAGQDGRFAPVPGGQSLLPAGVADGQEPLAAEGHLGEDAIRSGAPQVISDAVRERRTGDPLVRWLRARALVCVPMMGPQGLRGLLVAADDRPRTFLPHTVGLLANYANQAALALQSALLYQDVVRHLSQLSRLSEVSHSLASSLELTETLDKVLTSAADLLEAPVCSVMLTDPESGELVIKAARGFLEDDALYERLKPGEGLAGRAAESGLVMSSSDISRDGRFRFRERAREEGFHVGIAAPLIARGRTLGVLNLYRKTTREFTPEEERVLLALANSAAVAIENAHLYQESQERAQFLTAMMSEINHRIRNTLQAIAGLLSMELVRPQVSATDTIKRGISRIQTVAVVHEMMRGRELGFVDIKEVARRIFELTRQSITTAPSVEASVSGARVMLPSQKAISVALLLTELVDNALRHGLGAARPARLSISLAEAGGEVLLQVRDNGPGLPGGLDLDAIPAAAGMGLKIVRGLVEEDLAGSVQFESRGGLIVRARFPKK